MGYQSFGENQSWSGSFEANPTISTSAYSTGHRFGSVQTLTGATRLNGSGVILSTIKILDLSKQSAAFDFLFFNGESAPTIASADRSAIEITDAVMSANFAGSYHMDTTADPYIALGTTNNNSVWTPKNGIHIHLRGNASSNNLHVVPIIRASATFATTTAVLFYYDFLQN